MKKFFWSINYRLTTVSERLDHEKMEFEELLASDKFIVTAELFPPKGTNLSGLFQKAETLRAYVDAVNVTDNQRAIMRIGPLSVCHLLKEKGFEVILQLSCRDRNRLALQSDILSAAVLGIENILVLSGDHPLVGDHPEALPVYDLDSVQLIRTIKTLQEGKDLAGKTLNGKVKFCVGGVVNPSFQPLDLQIMLMKKKINSGAEFFQTQPIFSLDEFKLFLKKVQPLKTKILAGVFLVPSVKVAELLEKIGIKVPAAHIEKIKKAKDPRQAGIQICSETISHLRGSVKGVHIMSLGREEYIPEIIKAAGIKKVF